jgi:hypothetical protein
MKNEQKWLLQEMYNEGYRDIKIEGVYAFFVNPTFIENGGNFKIRDHTPRIPCKVLGLNPNIRKYSIASLLGFVEWERVPVDTPIIIETEHRTMKRHFAKYDGMNVWFFGLGGTSWSANTIKPCGDWKVRLAENERD